MITDKEALEIIKAYRQKLTDSVSNQLDKDIEAFDVAVEAIESKINGGYRWEKISHASSVNSYESLPSILNPLNAGTT